MTLTISTRRVCFLLSHPQEPGTYLTNDHVMYITAQRVAEMEGPAHGINAFLYLHGPRAMTTQADETIDVEAIRRRRNPRRRHRRPRLARTLNARRKSLGGDDDE